MGRQSITWTVGKLWFPTDLFGPFSPFDIDQDEKRGVDAANLAIDLGDLSSFRVIFAPLERQEDSRVGGRLKASLEGFEIHLMGGYFSGDRVVGGSLSHNIAGATARAEGVYKHPLEGDDRWSFVVNADAGLPHNVYAVIEYFYQSAGAASEDTYYRTMPLYFQGKLYGLARDYLGCRVEWKASALVKPGVQGVANLMDQSLFFGPRIEWKPIDKVKVNAGANLFVPYLSDSEFGLFPNAYYASIKASF